MQFPREYPVASFFALTLALSWAVWVPGTLLFSETASVALVMVGSFGPAVAAALLTKAQGRSLRAWIADVAKFRIGARWWLVALGLPVAVAAVNTVVFAVFVGELDFSFLPRRVGIWLTRLVPVLLVGGGNEELGWRGYALPHLQRDYGALTASVVIGVVWAVWHLPMIVLPGGMYAGRPFHLYLPMVVAFSVVLTWLYNSSGGSVPAAMLLHASFNVASVLIPVSLAVLQGTATKMLHMRARLVVLGIVALALVLYYGPETLSVRSKKTPKDERLGSEDAVSGFADPADR